MQYNLRAMQVFECIYRHRNIAKAAEELAVTPSAISHQLRYLRTNIGEDLISRSGRNITFTNRGEKLAETLSLAFSRIENSVQQSIGEESDTLRVAVCTAFGTGWLIPRMTHYPHAAKYKLQIKLGVYHPELTDCVADIFFTTTPIKEGFWSTKLMPEELVAVGRAEQLYPEHEQGYRLITTDIGASDYMEDWRDYLGLIQRKDLLADATVFGASHYAFATQMAIDGAGIALVPDFLAAPRLSNCGLQIWHDLRLPTGRSYYLNVKHARREEAPIRSFINWVRRTIVDDRKASSVQ